MYFFLFLTTLSSGFCCVLWRIYLMFVFLLSLVCGASSWHFSWPAVGLSHGGLTYVDVICASVRRKQPLRMTTLRIYVQFIFVFYCWTSMIINGCLLLFLQVCLRCGSFFWGSPKPTENLLQCFCCTIQTDTFVSVDWWNCFFFYLLSSLNLWFNFETVKVISIKILIKLNPNSVYVTF